MNKLETYTVKHEGETLEIDSYPREKIEELKERIRNGNKKLEKAWEDICKLDVNSQEWKDEMHKWHMATVKLGHYCNQLTQLGFTKCLYIDDSGKKYKKCLEGKLGCLVCPSSITYWESE